MDESTLMHFMTNTREIPAYKNRQGIRTIYESGTGPRLRASGHFFMDFATYGGTTEEVPKELIDRLESEGKLIRTFPNHPECNAWRLPDPA
jgi:hypothetical protein